MVICILLMSNILINMYYTINHDSLITIIYNLLCKEYTSLVIE